jgi:2-octaprenyl-6-methoxyphenol hydroxylase
VHRSGGPFTLVPLPDRDGLPCSAVVWMDDGAASLARMALDADAFSLAATERSAQVLGPLTLASQRAIWPIIRQHAARLSGERIALIAEAAHVMPPIGAQGLNMSLQDIATLLELSQKYRDDLGSQPMLDAYHKARFGDIQLRLRGIDLLNRASQAKTPLARDARAKGLSALYALPPVRRMLMEMGLGMRQE